MEEGTPAGRVKLKFPGKYLSLAISLVPAIVCAQITKADVEYVNKVFYPATVLLYSQDEHGSMQMHCTATAIEKQADGYEFVTASHCACKDDTEHEIAKPQAEYWFMTADEKDSKKFIAAKLKGCGYQRKGADIALFDVKTADVYPMVNIGHDPETMEPVINVASPLGMGKQVFTGAVTSGMVDREIVAGDINWTKAVLVQIPGTDGGSSGSAIVSLTQRAICAFLVGTANDTTMVAMPVSRMVKFRDELKAGTYKYWKDDTQPGKPSKR